LTKVADLCEKHGIKYYLIGGTLLGAIRHGGFIPWDDDIDIAMYRDDYDRFLNIADKELGEKFFIQYCHTDEEYQRYITKVRLNGTSYIEKSVAHINMHQGIFIDILPLDNVSNTGGLMLHLRGIIVRILFAIKTIKVGKDVNNACQFKKYLRKILRPLAHLVPNKVINRSFDYITAMSNKNAGKYTTSFASRYGWRKQLVPNEVYGKGVLVAFEGRKFRAPDQWDVLLAQLFGDYMKLPPEEQRVNHIISSFDVGEYRDEAKRKSISA
jgi:lipopolysaccharide cholinephosphotransferase